MFDHVVNPPRLRVVTVGPGPATRGGMASVQASLRRALSAEVDLIEIMSQVDGGRRQRLRTAVASLRELRRTLLSRRVDVVHVHVSQRGSLVREGAALLIARVYGVSVLAHCHGSRLAGDVESMPRVLRQLVSRLLRSATVVVVLGEPGRRMVEEKLEVPATRVRILSNPVQVPVTVPARTGVALLHLGRLGARKGSYTLLTALAELPAADSVDLRALLAGDGEVQGVSSRASELGLGRGVRVEGWIDEVRRDRELAAARVFVLPSRAEGLPVAMLEAMAWGLVPVVTDVGSITDVAIDGVNALIVPVDDVSSLAAALHRLLSNPDLVDRLGAQARADVATLAEPVWAGQLLALWRELVDFPPTLPVPPSTSL